MSSPSLCLLKKNHKEKNNVDFKTETHDLINMLHVSFYLMSDTICLSILSRKLF